MFVPDKKPKSQFPVNSNIALSGIYLLEFDDAISTSITKANKHDRISVPMIYGFSSGWSAVISTKSIQFGSPITVSRRASSDVINSTSTSSVSRADSYFCVLIKCPKEKKDDFTCAYIYICSKIDSMNKKILKTRKTDRFSKIAPERLHV